MSLPAVSQDREGASWRLAGAGPAWGLAIVRAMFAVLPLRLAQWALTGIIWGWFQHWNHPRIALIAAMRRVSPGSPYWAAWRAFRAYGYGLIERYYTYSGRLAPFIDRARADADGHALLEAATRDPRPLVLLASHSGHVEHTAFVLESIGRRVRAVAVRDPGAQGLLDAVGDPSVRLGEGSTIVADGSPAAGLAMLKALRDGDILALKADRPLPGASHADVVAVPFFGEPARLPLGPAKLICAAKSRALVVSVFRSGCGTYRCLSEEIDTASRDPRAIVRQYVAIQERHLRAFPDQWFNFYPYWPADEPLLHGVPVTVPAALRGAGPALGGVGAAALGALAMQPVAWITAVGAAAATVVSGAIAIGVGAGSDSLGRANRAALSVGFACAATVAVATYFARGDGAAFGALCGGALGLLLGARQPLFVAFAAVPLLLLRGLR